jgi:hypothetical protein
MVLYNFSMLYEFLSPWHAMTHPWIAYGRDAFHIWRVAANKFKAVIDSRQGVVLHFGD